MSSVIKICFVATDAASFNTLYRGQLEWLRDSKLVELTLICGGSAESLALLRAREVGKVIDCKFVRRPSFFKDVLSLIKLISIFIFNRFDVVVYSTPKALLIGGIAAFLSRQKQRVALFHGRVYENSLGLSRQFWSFLDRVVVFMSHKALFVSFSLRNAYLKDGLVSSEKALVINRGSANGVSGEAFKPRRDCRTELRRKLNFDDSDFVVICAGRICVDKGSLDIVRVVRGVKDKKVKFLFVGEIEDAASVIAFAQLDQDNIDYVHLPFTSEISKLFNASDLHLFLTHREGFGNVAIEAAASGVPTVAFDVVGVIDSVNHGVTGVKFKFGDVNGIVEWILAAASRPECHEFSFQNARQWVMSNFDESEVWRGYLDFYAKLNDSGSIVPH